MASLAALRKQAKELGVPKPMILRAETPEELQQIVDDFTSESNGGSTKAPQKKAVAKKKVAAKKNSTRDTNERKPTRKAATAKKSGGTRVPAKSGSGTAKRRGTAKSETRSNGYVPKGGRNLLDNVNFNQSDGWNPRAGSAPARIIAALKKAKGNRSKAFDALKGDLWDFVGKKKADGSKRTKAEAEEMLRYRISRTLFDFAIRTGQHESATNRVQYGTGGTGEGIYKPAKARKTATKTTTAKKSTAKRTTAKKGAAKRKTGSRK